MLGSVSRCLDTNEIRPGFLEFVRELSQMRRQPSQPHLLGHQLGASREQHSPRLPCLPPRPPSLQVSPLTQACRGGRAPWAAATAGHPRLATEQHPSRYQINALESRPKNLIPCSQSLGLLRAPAVPRLSHCGCCLQDQLLHFATPHWSCHTLEGMSCPSLE